MSETINPQVEIQPPLFAPDGSPSPEVKKALKEIEDEKNREYLRKELEEIEDRIRERGRDHAP